LNQLSWHDFTFAAKQVKLGATPLATVKYPLTIQLSAGEVWLETGSMASESATATALFGGVDAPLRIEPGLRRA
jgi:hypothetical protein